MSSEIEAARRHQDAWADTHDGYRVSVRQAVLECLWCDYSVMRPTKREAVAAYQHDHEGPIQRVLEDEFVRAHPETADARRILADRASPDDRR